LATTTATVITTAIQQHTVTTTSSAMIDTTIIGDENQLKAVYYLREVPLHWTAVWIGGP